MIEHPIGNNNENLKTLLKPISNGRPNNISLPSSKNIKTTLMTYKLLRFRGKRAIKPQVQNCFISSQLHHQIKSGTMGQFLIDYKAVIIANQNHTTNSENNTQKGNQASNQTTMSRQHTLPRSTCYNVSKIWIQMSNILFR